jgi:tape measure domain-containing protein
VASEYRIVVVLDGSAANANASKLRGNLRGIKQEADSVTGALRRMAQAFIVGNMIRETTRLADAFTNVRNRIRNVVGEQGLETTYKKLFDVAQRTRQPIEAVTQSFQRTALAVREYGYTTNNAIKFTENLSKIMATSGTTTTEGTQAMIQLSQALGSGTLRGDELRSVMEQMPEVLRIVADSMGVSTGKIKELAKAGKITTVEIMKAILDATDKIGKQYAAVMPTIGQRVTEVKNAFIDWFGRMATDSGALEAVTDALGFLATHMEEVGRVMIMVAEIVGGAFVLKAFNAAKDAILAMNAAAMANPFVFMVKSLVVLIPLVLQFGDEMEAAARKAAGWIPGNPLGVDTGVVPEENQLGGPMDPSRQKNLDSLMKQGWRPVENFDPYVDQARVDSGQIRFAQVNGEQIAVTKDAWMESVRNMAATADNTTEGLQNLSDGIGSFLDELGIQAQHERARNLVKKAQGAGKKKGETDFGIPFEHDLNDPFSTFGFGPGQSARDWGDMDRDNAKRAAEAERLARLNSDFDHTIFMGTMSMQKQAEAEEARRAKLADKQKLLEMGGTERGWRAIAKIATDTAGDIEKAFTDTFNALNQQLVNFVVNGKFSLSSLVDSVLGSLTTILLHAGEAQLGKSLNLPGFAYGGSFQVGGTGGTDSQMMMMRVTPGEVVSVTNDNGAGGMKSTGRGGYPEYGGKGPPVSIYNTWDPGTMINSLDTRTGRRAVRNTSEVGAQSLSSILRAAGGRR